MAWTVARDALLLLALASFAYYLVAIFAALRFFGRRDSERFHAAHQHPQTDLRPGPRDLPELRQPLRAGLSGLRNIVLRERRAGSRHPGDCKAGQRFSGSPH